MISRQSSDQSLHVTVDPLCPNAIVANGRRRILEGSARKAALRMQARLSRRTARLVCRASFLGRLVIRYRVWRFIQREVVRKAPAEALYSTRKFSLINLSTRFLRHHNTRTELRCSATNG